VKIRFGDYTLDDDRRQLLGAGASIHISPKAYELLKLLLVLRPKAVSKADLQARLWPDTFVSEVNLAALISELRAALGEPGRHGRFIRTVHGFGYAFGYEEAVTENDREDPAHAVVVPDSERATPARETASSAATCWLTWGEREYPLREGAQVIGRGAAADVRIDALSISREHARLFCGADGATVEDLESKNGTWIGRASVNGPTRIEDGDEIRLETVTLVFHSLRAAASTMTVERVNH